VSSQVVKTVNNYNVHSVEMQIHDHLKGKVALNGITLWADRCMKCHRNTNSRFRLIAHYVNRSGYWHQRADDRHGNPPTRQPGAVSGQRQSWKTPGELGV